MTFINEVVIYQSEETKVYINQCHNKGKKTKAFAVRRDDKTGFGHYLGSIRFDGGWRQYVFLPETETRWSAGCMEGIIKFLKKINEEWRAKWTR